VLARPSLGAHAFRLYEALRLLRKERSVAGAWFRSAISHDMRSAGRNVGALH
jgi:hypothetical protein